MPNLHKSNEEQQKRTLFSIISHITSLLLLQCIIHFFAVIHDVDVVTCFSKAPSQYSSFCMLFHLVLKTTLEIKSKTIDQEQSLLL